MNIAFIFPYLIAILMFLHSQLFFNSFHYPALKQKLAEGIIFQFWCFLHG